MLEPTQPGMVKFFMGKIHEKYGEKKIMDKILIWESHIFHFVKIGG